MYEDDETEDLSGEGGAAALLAKYTQDQEAAQAEEAARIQSRWQRGTQALQQRRAGPSKTETVAQALLAFGRPTRGGGWAALGNAGNVLAERNASVKSAEEQRKQQMLALENARDDSLSELSAKYGGDKRALLGKLAVQAAKPVTERVEHNPLTGVLTFTTGPNRGKPVNPGGPSAATSSRPVKVSNMSEATAIPFGAIAQLPDGSLVRNTAKGVEAASPRAAKEAATPDEIAAAVGAREEAKILAKDRAQAKVALPNVRQSVGAAIRGIEEMRTHPGLLAAVGVPNPFGGNLLVADVPGSPAADFSARLSQLKGTAFLQAYQTLKGTGSIANAEGKRAEDAVARLNRAQSKKEFQRALTDYEEALAAGLAILEEKAKDAAPRPSGGPPATRYDGGGPRTAPRGTGNTAPANPAKLSDAELKKQLGL